MTYLTAFRDTSEMFRPTFAMDGTPPQANHSLRTQACSSYPGSGRGLANSGESARPSGGREGTGDGERRASP